MSNRSIISDGDNIDWDERCDVLVVGCGAAGISAAIEAADGGADVIVIDRFSPGGASRLSGGIYYAGGGTSLQKEAGYDETAENLYNYLIQEIGHGVVHDDVIRAYSDQSVDNFNWIVENGVPFGSPNVAKEHSSYPSDDTSLYYSGNETVLPFRDASPPVPRGHRPMGKGLTGHKLFDALHEAAKGRNIRIITHTRATKLIRDISGDVVGVEAKRIHSRLGRLIHTATNTLGKASLFFRPFLKPAVKLAEVCELLFARPVQISATAGVIISAGGYMFNREMVDRLASRYSGVNGLGTLGDSGTAITLGKSVGAGTHMLHKCSAWVFISPPPAYQKGLVLAKTGQRIGDEESYGAKMGEHILDKADDKSFVIYDSKIKALCDQYFNEQSKGILWLIQIIGYRKIKPANSLEELSRQTGIPAQTLLMEVAKYNKGIAKDNDEFGKRVEKAMPIEKAPFYAAFKTTKGTSGISLGGLTVNGVSAEVLNTEGEIIPGLYAAGRSAAGLCSNNYVSGLSLSDCVFTGRNAGRSAARRVQLQ